MAFFQIPVDPEYSESIRKLETTDRAHANVFNRIFEILIGNMTFLRRRILRRVKVGAEDTPLEKGETLFVVDDWPTRAQFNGAAFDNLTFSQTAPGSGTNWAQADRTGGETGTGEAVEHVIHGNLTVSEAIDSEAVFYAQTNKK